MRVNIYAEEMTERIRIISKEIEGKTFTGLRLYTELPTSLPPGVWLCGPTPAVEGAYFEPPSDATRNVKGPFMHRPDDDDSSAVTFWGKNDLRVVLRIMMAKLDAHYAGRSEERAEHEGPVIATGPEKATERERTAEDSFHYLLEEYRVLHGNTKRELQEQIREKGRVEHELRTFVEAYNIMRRKAIDAETQRNEAILAAQKAEHERGILAQRYRDAEEEAVHLRRARPGTQDAPKEG